MNYNNKGYCLFCHDEHCISELYLRPLFLELNAFQDFGEFTREYLIENSNILIDYSKEIVYYRIFPDLVITEMNFSGDKKFYFFAPLIPDFETAADAKKLINTIKSGWMFGNLEKHGIETIK